MLQFPNWCKCGPTSADRVKASTTAHFNNHFKPKFFVSSIHWLKMCSETGPRQDEKLKTMAWLKLPAMK